MATLKGTYSKGTETIEYKNKDGKVATVGFRMGPEENLTSASFTAQNGIFYLTSDTHRLYIGNSDGSVSPVNQGVITVTALPDYSNAIPGQFYYISTSNVLATYNGTDWFQINPDTQVESIEHAATAGSAGANSAIIQTTVGQIGGSHSTQQVLSNEVTIKGANEIAVTVDSNNVITPGTNVPAKDIDSSVYNIYIYSDSYEVQGKVQGKVLYTFLYILHSI